MEKKPPANEPVEKTNKCTLDSGKKSKKMVMIITIGQNQNFARLNAGLSSNSSCAFWRSEVFVKTEWSLFPFFLKNQEIRFLKKVNSTP